MRAALNTAKLERRERLTVFVVGSVALACRVNDRSIVLRVQYRHVGDTTAWARR